MAGEASCGKASYGGERNGVAGYKPKNKGGKHMVYEWKSGTRIKADAQECGEMFEKLSETEEGLTAETLLEANKPETAPLHNEYEWNDSKAAHEWRLQQSRHFINSIAIKVLTKDEEEIAVRAFHITTEKSCYESITAIITEKDKREALLASALSELNAFKRKYELLTELTPIFKAIMEVNNE